MSVLIKQKPLYDMLATDEEIIFAVDDIPIVATKVKVKFTAEIWLSHGAANPFTQTKIATLKATPNEAGVGIFDFSRILESYVSPDYLGGKTIVSNGVQYYTSANQQYYNINRPHSIHQIDKHSVSRNACKRFGIIFNIEYADNFDDVLQTGTDAYSGKYYVHNAVRQEDDGLAMEVQTGRFGFNYDHHNFALNDTDGKFLTNAPTTQYIGENDYCTIAYFNQSDSGAGADTQLGNQIGTIGATDNLVERIKMQFYYNGSSLGAPNAVNWANTLANGSSPTILTNPKVQIQYTGVGTGNLVGAGVSLPTNWDYYKVWAEDDDGNEISKDYYFYKQEVCKGFEKFRLTWLNRLGVWDYFNFTKKNVRKVNSKRETYQQIKGSWNDEIYRKHGYKGGTKTFSTNSKEVITLQTDYITEEAAQWLEELFTSPDVYVLQERAVLDGGSTSSASSVFFDIINKFIQPCIVKTSSYTRKTTANDKLKQYTLEIEMSHNKKIQRA